MFQNSLFLLIFLLINATHLNGMKSAPNEEDIFTCSNSDDIPCATGTVCIKSELECNGQHDCPDGSDELESICDYKLCKPPKFYTCKDENKTCIIQNFRCDGRNDCPLDDDEENCDNYQPHHEKINCGENEFQCIKDNMCIAMEMVCDGIPQCMDKSDEIMGCLNIDKKCKGFLCKNRHCLTNKSWVCDGRDDCGDGSDELNCSNNCTSANKQFLCSDNTTCLSIEKVCDKENDCKDGSDEGGICMKFSNNKACESHYCPDVAECFIWPSGPVCVCPKGFSYNSNKKICEDINECQIYGICSQGCKNKEGSYSCTCAKRFRLNNDGRTCKTISSTDPILFYSAKTSINSIHLRTNHHDMVTDKVRQVIGITYDGTYMYWTNVALNTESVVKSRLDGSKMETLLTTGISLPEDIAVDWITGNLYFSDAIYMHIAVCSHDGRFCSSLVSENVQSPRSIALYPQEGRMYWSDWGSKPMIAVAHMDGTFAAPFINENIEWPSGVTLDWPNNRLYWIDAKIGRIESVNLDGTGRQIVTDKDLQHPYGLAVFENNIYWSDWNAMSIETCDKFTCKDRKTVIKDRKVYDLHIYHNSIQPIIKNPCRDTNCTHLCLLASNETFSCRCPHGMTLNVDQLSCSKQIKKEGIYIGMRNYLITMEHETFGRHQMERAKVLPIFIHKMEHNLLNGHLFIADNIEKAIYDYDIENEKLTELIRKNIGNVSSLAFDYLSNNLYWSDIHHGTVEVFSLETKHRATVHHYMGANKPIAIAVIPQKGQMFVALKSSFGHVHIDIQALDGSSYHRHLIESNLGDGDFHFAVDRSIDEIFWTDSSKHQISFSDYSGESYHIFKIVTGEPQSIAVLLDDVFWTKKNSLDIFWTPKHSPDTTKELILPKHEYTSKEDPLIVVPAVSTVVSSHPCLTANGNCSHVCVSSGLTTKTCLCPPGMVFTNKRNETCEEAWECEFRCGSGECLTKLRLCNNIKDCIDGSDEKECNEQKAIQCYQDQFRCADGTQCIDQQLRCDKTNDCKDKSDEADCKHYNYTTKCHNNQYACTNGVCIDLSAVCDGNNDCDDGADELKCHDKDAMMYVCKSDMFSCANGQCIPKEWVCDESADCIDGSDEHNCPEKKCPNGYVKCSHGQCLDMAFVCDGINNCGDNSDELNCTLTNSTEIKCQEFDSNNERVRYQCLSDKRICIDVGARCNGTAECPRGEDEANCATCQLNEFECANKKCIPKTWQCDKINDCGDRSDEIGCEEKRNVTSLINTGCPQELFDCKDGNCISMEQVCDDHFDCASKIDESSVCKTSCDNHPCQHKCNKSPYGPICSCHEGFTLGGDHKSCFDINECKVYRPCAQKCENLLGSFRCSCYVGYMLRADKLACKSIEAPRQMLYTSLNFIYSIGPSLLGVLWSSNGSKISGMDVNVHLNLLYFTVQDSGTIYEMSLKDHRIQYVTNIGNPKHLAVDWVTNNVYFFDENTNPSIKICHMEQKVCTRIIPLRYREVVKGMIIDSANNQIFYVIVHPSFSSSSESFIYSHNLDGTRSKMLLKASYQVTGLTYDSNKQIIYFADPQSSIVWSAKYDGSDRQILFKNNHFITKPSFMNLYEDQLVVLNSGSNTVAQCKVYGDQECVSFQLNAYNAENLLIIQASRQKEKDNNCIGNNCSLICVPAELGPKCLCHGGTFTEPGKDCKDVMSNDLLLSPMFSTQLKPKSPKSSNSLGKVLIILSILIGTSFVVFAGVYIYQTRYKFRKEFDVRMYFENPTSSTGVDNAEVKLCRTPQVETFEKYNEVYLNSQVSPVLEEYDNSNTSEKCDDTERLIY